MKITISYDGKVAVAPNPLRVTLFNSKAVLAKLNTATIIEHIDRALDNLKTLGINDEQDRIVDNDIRFVKKEILDLVASLKDVYVKL